MLPSAHVAFLLSKDCTLGGVAGRAYILSHPPLSLKFCGGFFWPWWGLGSRLWVLSEHKGQNWVAGVGRGQPPPCLPLGADIAVISALPQLPPPPWLALPSCVKTLAGFACWPTPPGLGPGWSAVSGVARCREWAVDQWAPWDLWPGSRPQFSARPSHRPAARVVLAL